MATPDFMLSTEYTYYINIHDSYVLPAGMFVRPINYTYVPKHIKDEKTYRAFDPKEDVYCYTPRGIIFIPRSIIYQVGGSAFLDIDSYK